VSCYSIAASRLAAADLVKRHNPCSASVQEIVEHPGRLMVSIHGVTVTAASVCSSNVTARHVKGMLRTLHAAS